MPENVTNTAENTTTQDIKQPAKLGKMQRVEMTFPNEQSVQENIDNKAGTDTGDNKNVTEGANATSGANNGGVADDKTKAIPPAPTMPTKEQLKEYFKTLDIDYDGDEKIKEKLTAPAQTPTELTEEQKKAKELAKEKRLLDKFISGGGKVEDYVAITGVAQTDETKFALDMAKTELIKSGFTLEEAENFLKEQYFQVDDAELEQYEDETDKAFKKRTKEYFAKQLANLSSPIRTKAAGILADLNSAIEAEDLQVQQEIALSSKIEDDFKALPRKLSIEIGEVGGKTVSPIEYDVSETDIAEVKDMLKDPAKRQQLLFNQDGSVNITRLIQAFVKEKLFDSASKISYLESQTRNNEIWQKTFPARSAQELGVGGSPSRSNGQTGNKIAGVGKVQRVQPQPNRL